MVEQLLPCPFCGGHGDIEQGPASQASGSYCSYRGWCDSCRYGLEWTTDHSEAIAAWNKRPALEGYNPDAVRDVVEALDIIAEPIDKSKAVGDPWAYYSDLQNVARAALARLGGAS